MARIRGHRPFDASKPLFVKRPFDAFAVGDALSAAYIASLPPRRLRQLHDQRRIGHEKPSERNGAEDMRVKPVQPPPKKQPQQPRR